MPTHRLPGFRTRQRPFTVAGRYLLLDQIGAGGMGSVWRAVDLRTDDVVALKVLGHHSSALLARFVREQAVRVRHPHIVAPTGWAAEDDIVVLAMDLVRGGSVARLLSEHGPLPAGYVATLVEQILQALGAVHGAGLVHRDLKPANLLLEATGVGPPHVRLGDFGVAAAIAEQRFTTAPGAIGTEGYMAPEQATGGAPHPGQDLYALGRCAWQLATGLPPRDQTRIPSHPLRPLLERLLVPAPSHRLCDADEALRLLRRLAIPYEPGPPVPDRLGPDPVRHHGVLVRHRSRRGHSSTFDPVGWAAVLGCTAVLVGCLSSLLGWWP